MVATANFPNPLPVGAATGAATERSGSITTGGAVQDWLAVNASRKGFEFQNLSVFDIFIRDKGAGGTNVASAAGDSVWIPPGAYYVPPQVSGNAYSLFCATTGAKFYAKEW